MFLAVVDLFVELFGEGSEDEAELMEPEFLGFSCIEVYHVVVLHLPACGEIVDVVGVHVSLVADVDQFEQVDQIEVLLLGYSFPQFLQPLLLDHNFLQNAQ